MSLNSVTFMYHVNHFILEFHSSVAKLYIHVENFLSNKMTSKDSDVSDCTFTYFFELNANSM